VAGGLHEVEKFPSKTPNPADKQTQLPNLELPSFKQKHDEYNKTLTMRYPCLSRNVIKLTFLLFFLTNAKNIALKKSTQATNGWSLKG